MNQPNLEAVREQVLRIARQIEQLCQSEIAPNDFFPQFLQLLAEAIAAEAAVFWRLDENRQIGLAYEVGLSQIGLSDAPAALTNCIVSSRVFSMTMFVPGAEPWLVTVMTVSTPSRNCS